MRRCHLIAAGLAAGTACARPAPPADGPSVVIITATDYAFNAPDTIPAGRTTFRLVNQGKELHHASLVWLGDGKTIADFGAALQAAMKNHGPPPAWASFAGGPNAVTPGDTASATQLLEPGSYVLVCWIPTIDGTPHTMKGMMRAIVVIGAATARPAEPAEPAPDVVVTLNDYDFQFARPLTAGRRTIRVENAGPQAHEIVITALPSGKTLQDFVAWEKGGEKGPLPTGRWLGGVATLDAGAHAQFTATFQPGNYLLLWLLARREGRPAAPGARDGEADHCNLGR